MALVSCPDCGQEVSSMAKICPKCARPDPGSDKPIEPTAAQTSPPNETAGFSIPSWAKWAAGVVIGLIIIANAVPNNSLKMIKLSSDSPLFAATTVTANMVNEGDPISVNYWVKKGASDKKYCGGSTYFGRGERRTITFKCQALTNYSGRFTMTWAPK